MGSPGNLVQSVERALEALEAVAAAGELGVTELARQLDLHVATVHNLLRTLAARQFLTNRHGRYRLGPAAAMLATRWDPALALPDLVQPELVRISQASGEAASATVLVGWEARLIAFQPGTETITIHFPQWLWPQGLNLATGRLLVALGDERLWDGFVERSPDARPEWDASAWRADLQRLRDAGCCALRTDRDGGQALFAAPLRTRGGVVVATIGAACPAFRADAARCERLTAAVWRSAAELSAVLGGSLPDAPPPLDWTCLPVDHQADELPKGALR